METSKNDTEKKSEEKQSKTSNPFEGFGGKDMNIPEWLMHLLTGVGTMGANYMLWIKPIMEKMETMNLQLTKQDSRIKELENILDRLIRQLKTESNENVKEMDEDYFTFKRNKERVNKYGGSSRIVNM